jgi:hypothetical protein
MGIGPELSDFWRCSNHLERWSLWLRVGVWMLEVVGGVSWVSARSGGPCDGGLTSLVRDLKANELSRKTR